MAWKAALSSSVLLIGLAAGGVGPAAAQEYPWCTLSRSDGIQSCGFSTYEQCAALRAPGGLCVRNLAVPDNPPAANSNAQRRPRR